MSESFRLLPFHRDQPPSRLLERFRGEEGRIEELWRRDREFREICRDYREAVAAMNAAGPAEAEERTRPLVELVAELEREMVAAAERER